ncbi:MAG: gliding motility-associated C-terminal domain-containing protein [Bacteroidota bacterium]
MKKLLLLLLLIFCYVNADIFGQCTNPAGPGGDDCISATPLCDPALGFDDYCDQLDNNNSGGTTFPGCPNNVLNNDEWFVFVASGNSLDITITPTNCGQVSPTNPGVQAAMYEGSCSGDAIATQCNCTTAPFTLSGPTTPGNTYYIVIDGCAGDICDYEVQDNNGTTIPAPPPDLVPEGPIIVCPGITSNYTLPIPNADIYTWSMNPPGLGLFGTLPPTGASMNIEWLAPGQVDICVVGTNACNLSSANPPPVCLTVTIEIPEVVMDEVDGCLFENVMCVEAPTETYTVTNVPTTYPSTQIDPVSGCEYTVLCTVNPIIPDDDPQGQQELCGPATYEICPGEVLFDSGLYTITCQDPVSGCDYTATVDLAIFNPEANIAQPVPELDCGGNSSVMLDGTGSTLFSAAPGATVEIEWTGPGIVGTNADPIVSVNEPGEYCLTITFSRNGTVCSDEECVMVELNAEAPNAPTLAGEANPCEGVVYTYDGDITTTPVPTDFGWITPNGESFTTIDSNTIEIDWTGSAGGDLCVYGINDCGNGDTTCINITIGETPNLPTVDGPIEVCAVDQDETFTITNVQAGVTYTWTVPNGASFNGTGASITVNFDGADLGPGQVCATASNGCGTSLAGCFNVDVLAPPPLPDMSGPLSVCSNGTGYTYSVANGQAGDTYDWTAPAGATITGTGSSVDIDFNGSQTGQVCVSITNECGTSAQDCENVTVIQAPEATITGMGELCEGTSEDIDLTISVTGTAPWDVTYTVDGMNPTMITINASPYTLTVNQPGVYELTVLNSSGGCDGSVNGTATITENPLPTADLSGNDGICENSGDQGELNIDLTGTAPWTIGWEANGVPQASVTANASPYTLNVSEAQAGTIVLTSVEDDNGCVGDVSGTGMINILEAPTVSSVERLCDPTNTEYTVTIVIQGGDPTSYSVTPANGMLTGNTFVSNPILSSLGYSFTISDVNDCDPVLVEGSFECNCETVAGDMDLDPLETCGDGPIDVSGLYDNTAEMLDGDDARIFVLHNGNGTTIIDPIINTYTTLGDVSFDAATMTYGVTYYLSAVVGNSGGTNGVDLTDPCLSVSLGTPITFFEIPSATLSGTDAVCEGEDAMLTVDFTGSAPWSLTYDDGNGNTNTITGINTNPYTLIFTPTMTGLNNVSLVDMTDTNCPGDVAGAGEVTVNTGVVIDSWSTECNSTATAFTVTINISGGDSDTYVVTGIPGTLNGNVFTSDEIASGPGIGFTAVVTDINDCDPQTVSQTEVPCDCTSDAGTMDPNEVRECGDGPINVSVTTNEVLDGDDILLYVLHSGNGTIINGEIAFSPSPSFSFDPAVMMYGTTYYISAVVGNADGTGSIDLNEPCLSVAPGTPVTFYEIPTASISGGTIICPGESADLVIDLTGDSPWSVTVNGQVYDNINGSPFILQVQPDATTTYMLENVADNNCDRDLMEAQTVTLHDPPVITFESDDCNPTGTAYTLCFTISGGDPASYAVTPNTGTLTGNQFCSELINSGDGYSFSVTDAFNCTADVISALERSCECVTAVGDLLAAPIDVCRNETTPDNIAYDFLNENLDPNDVLNYVLYNGNVALATNPLNTEFSFNPGNMVLGQVYEICPVAGDDDGSGNVDFNDQCFVIGGCVEVVFNALPTAAMSGVIDICQGEIGNLTVDLTGTGPWELTYEDAAGVSITETATANPYTLSVSPAITTNFSLISVTDANGCSNAISGSDATVIVNQPPTTSDPIETCNALETEYTVTFTITGGDPTSYTVDLPGTLVGNVFTSDPFPSNSDYIFLVDDDNGCGPTIVEGEHVCNCLTQVGTMSVAPLIICGNELTPATIYDNTNEVLDPDDIVWYYLMNFNPVDFDPSFAIASNPNEPVFGFDPATMSPGTQYYIVAVVGSNDGTGEIDLDDLCLSQSSYLPVRFYAQPEITILDPDPICQGDFPTIEITVLSGFGPYDIDFTVGGMDEFRNGLFPIGNTITISDIFVPASATLELVAVEDAFCSNTASGSVEIVVNSPVSAGSAATALEYCEGDNQTIVLDDFMSGSDPGGTWTTTSGQIIPNGSLNVGTLPVGDNILTYTVNGTDPCPDDFAELNIEITENPVADAGPDLSLDCNTTSVTLNVGSGTTPGATVTWTGTGILNPNDPTQVVNNPGLYTLTATIGQCTAVDVMEVTINVSQPQLVLNEVDVSCFGETDGFVIIESVEGGVPPYTFSLDGGPFVPQQSFLNLAPGNYSIVVRDALGCTTPDDFDIEEPVEVTVNLFDFDDTMGVNPIVDLGESATLTINTNPGVGALDTIIWFPNGIDSLCPGCPTIEVTPDQQTVYSVLVDVGGCRAEDLLTLFISKERRVFVPNAFSPNEDAINDFLVIYTDASVANIKSFYIFNRWGETVFQQFNFPPNSVEPEHAWDGRHRGEYVNPGVFVWFAEFEFTDGTTDMLQGDINVIRN